MSPKKNTTERNYDPLTWKTKKLGRVEGESFTSSAVIDFDCLRALRRSERRRRSRKEPTRLPDVCTARRRTQSAYNRRRLTFISFIVCTAVKLKRSDGDLLWRARARERLKIYKFLFVYLYFCFAFFTRDIKKQTTTTNQKE